MSCSIPNKWTGPSVEWRAVKNWEFKKRRRLLQPKRDIKIELCPRLSVWRLLHVGQVVPSRQSVLSLACHEWFSCKNGEWKIYCCGLALSPEPQIWKFHVVVCQATLKNCLCKTIIFAHSTNHTRELKQPWRRPQQKRHKFAYLTMKNNSFARFARAFLIFVHFADVLVLSASWNDLFCGCVDDLSIRWQSLNFVFLFRKR